MASRIIHLAITNELIKKFEFADVDRLRFGSIVPDATYERSEYFLSHFKMQIGNETERTYNLTKYRELFWDNMKADDLYLGYYLHLIQDLLFRHFVYDKYLWDSKPKGNIERLHDDYRQINAYVIKKYDLQKNIYVPTNFANEKISKIAVFCPLRFLEEFKMDFEPTEYKERFFFTDSMVDEYISWSVSGCEKELDKFKNGAYYFDEYEWSWGK